MGEFFKNIKGQVFEFFVILLIPLILYKSFYPYKFGELHKMIFDKYKSIEIILEFIVYSLLFYSIVVSGIFLFITVIKKPIEMIYSSRYKWNREGALYFISSYHRFFRGSLDRVSFIYRWTIITLGYLYVINQKISHNIWLLSKSYYESLGGFLKFILLFPGSFLGLILLMSIYGIFSMVANRYLLPQSNQNLKESQEA
ncbi:hypothetical protein BVG16_28850 [Paenibacillus selenitireducens]|uniref:Uncharacterized protein n=1 Tax=Paenibacillus selenitireducens TaxID=1324314 RepID=A0A1T2X0V1_9BACL|nr:hypothetical protein [Paenibacillus selenitireducens]OPA73472.1 hypothetical protein BVG16_28850 [Paenibacillus selenitireducens]